jgi:hypothetical protein
MRRTGLLLIITAMLFSLGCALPKFIGSLFNDSKTRSAQRVDINNKKFDYKSVDKGLGVGVADQEVLDKYKENKRFKTEVENINNVIDKDHYSINIP